MAIFNQKLGDMSVLRTFFFNCFLRYVILKKNAFTRFTIPFDKLNMIQKNYY